MVHFIILVTFVLGCTHALTDEEMKENMVRAVMRCTKTIKVDMADLLKLQVYVVPNKPEVKCLLACAYKKEGMITDDGKYNMTLAYDMAKQMKNGDEKRLVNAKKVVEICSKVNDVKVSDGDKGCERATLLFKCITTNAPKFGFQV